jgi:hypothetical protein
MQDFFGEACVIRTFIEWSYCAGNGGLLFGQSVHETGATYQRLIVAPGPAWVFDLNLLDYNLLSDHR